MSCLFSTLAHYENLQDKLAKLKDARDALDALREEHNEKKRRELEEQNRLRQIQMVRPSHVPHTSTCTLYVPRINDQQRLLTA